MSFFIGNAFCRLCHIDVNSLLKELTISYIGLNNKGLIIKRYGSSARLPSSKVIWFNDEAIDIDSCDHKVSNYLKIYRLRYDVNAIFHAESAYIYAAVKDGLIDTIHAEATLVLGDIILTKDNDVSKYSIGEPLRPIRVIICNNEIYALGACIHEARAFIEIMDEWARVKVIANRLGGARYAITLERLRDLGSRYARAIKFGGRSVR
ncbi:MAG: hypothetical protein QW416_01415 [Candidatus Nitrosocaldaceae archaeon]